MHTFSETGAGVPAFLAKLWRLVEDQETNNLIYWSKDGRSFIIQNQAQFARELLPLNYKHNNMASFIRQLNMYGFHKITSIDNGGLKFDRDEMEFTHPCFKRGCPYLLEHIKRKIANAKQHQQLIDEKAGIKVESVSKVLNEVKVMRGRQDSLDSRFSVMKQENEALWREIATLRQKHIKQQQIVNKLIQFLVTIVQPSRNMSGVKRTFQLMINDAPKSSKSRKASETETGPVIHELTEELLYEAADTEEIEDDIVSGPPSPHFSVGGTAETHHQESLSPRSNIERPNSNLSTSSQYYEQQSNQSIDDVKCLNSSNTNSNGSNSENNLAYNWYMNPEYAELSNESSHFVEENVLTTPLVKQEIAKRNEKSFLKQKQQQQKERQQLQQLEEINQQNKLNQSSSIKTLEHRNSRKRKHIKEEPFTEYVTNSKTSNDAVKIKIENNLDPLMFLDTSPANSYCLSPSIDPALISPNSSVSNSTVNAPAVNTTDCTDKCSNEKTSELTRLSSSRGKAIYEDFLNPDMPSDLFEDSPMRCDINLSSSSSKQHTPVASTSKACSTSKESKQIEIEDEKSKEQNKSISNNKNNMTVVKYLSQKSPDDIMKLHTPEDIHCHLDGIQGDLENLKDLLRGEGYSFDTNTLSGNGNSSNRIQLSQPVDTDIWTKLFNDSDILSPYGLSLSNISNDLSDNNSGKTGSELTTYQPYGYDLSDILDINNEGNSELDESRPLNPSDMEGPCSTLNTPAPETRKAPF